MTRRHALSLIPAGRTATAPTVSLESISGRLPHELPAGVAAILAGILNQPPRQLNTDWFGTMPLVGVLQWCRRGIDEGKSFADAWLTHHLQTKEVARYTGNRSRVVWTGAIPSPHMRVTSEFLRFAKSSFDSFEDERARRVCTDVASSVLHRTARNRGGLLGHDDTSDFAIPDVTFFAVSSLMIGAWLDGKNEAAYRDQAIYQLRTSFGQKMKSFAK